MSAPSRTPSLVVNDASDFQPCRAERCKILGVHPAHEEETGKRSVQYKACPHCKGPLTRQKGKRAFCDSSTCGWRKKDAKAPQEQLHA